MKRLRSRISLSAECPAAVAARKFGDDIAVDAFGEGLSFKQLDARISSAARGMAARGVAPGDVVGLFADNGVDLLCVMLGLMRLGATAAPISTRLPPRAVEQSLTSVGSNRLVADGALSSSVSSSLRSIAVWSLQEIAAFDRSTSSTRCQVDPHGVCVAVFTSGSTGEARAVALSLSALVHSAFGANLNIPLGRGDRWLLSLPLYHVGGLGIVFRCLLAGATVVLPDRSETLADSVLGRHVTHLSAVPTQLRRMLDAAWPISGLKAILAGGAPMPEDVLRAYRAVDAPIYLTYGLTEMASQVATTSPEDPAREPHDAGSVLPFRSVRIADDGEILVRGQALCSGYLRAGRLEPALDAEGWFHTGDIGFFDSREHLHVRGRRDNMFVSGGENIYPEEIERALENLGQVVRAIVVDVPHHEFGFRPAAFIEFSGPALSVDDLRVLLQETLPRFKHPVAVFAFPENSDGALDKPRRGTLRELARRRTAGDRPA